MCFNVYLCFVNCIVHQNVQIEKRIICFENEREELE